MRDMTMLTGVPSTFSRQAAALTPEQEMEVRVKLIQALQMTLEPNEVLSIFFLHLKSIIPVGGIQFRFANDKDITKLGNDAIHHCDYRLTTDEGYLGEIIFNRSKRFTEAEQTRLEILLGALIYPLRNAMRFKTAMLMALMDPLTRLGNRAALDNALHRELQLADRHKQELSLLMIDVDHFKKINDKHGHARGDEVLQAIARTIANACRESDLSFRFGGEEFVVLLSKTNEIGAGIIAERLRKEVNKLDLVQDGKHIQPTVSIGISTHMVDQKENINQLFERADKALYEAKQSGRNCVVNSSKILS